MTKAINEEVYKIIQSKKELSKINGEDIIKNALLSIPKNEDEGEEIEKSKIADYL